MIDDLDPGFVVLLRQRFLGGATTADIVRLFAGKVPPDGMGRMMASEYLQEAFLGTIFQTKVIGAWDYFEGGTWSAEEVGTSLDEMCTDWLMRKRFSIADQED